MHGKIQVFDSLHEIIETHDALKTIGGIMANNVFFEEL
jgi:hypothetical protein